MGDVPSPHPTSPTTVGWREWVALPGLGVPWVKAKIDTGARSSALHAFDLEPFERDGSPWVRFEVHPWQRNAADAVVAELPVHDERLVRSSTGHTQHRHVVRTEVALAGRTVVTDLTLTRRDEMGFRMLVGRDALRQGFLVDAHHSYLGGRPKRVVRRKNRGVEG
jgi:hypothetical protein